MSDIVSKIHDLSDDQRAQLAQLVKQKLAQKQRQQLYDVVILGGGLAGSTLAIQLKKKCPKANILIVEKNQYPVPEAAFKVGESIAELGAHYLSDVVGLREHLRTDQIVKAGLRYFFTAKDNSEIARRMEVGLKEFPSVPGYQFDRGRLENHLYQINLDSGVTFWNQCKVEAIEIGEPHQITLKRSDQTEQVTARWVVDASGRTAMLKRQLNLSEDATHDINAVWFRFGMPIDVDEWSNNEQWKSRVAPGLRRLGTGHLMGRGYWIWMIALPSGGTSLGIVSDPKIHPHQDMNRFERALEWLKKYEPQLAQMLEENPSQLQDFHVLRHFSHGCKRVYSPERWCITGDAGVFADPLYSPGTDFIGMGNSLITDLIGRDLAGEDIRGRIEQYNLSFLNTYKLYLITYENQYPLMGNPQVIMAKIVWDWAIYWGLTALLFFQGNKLFDWSLISALGNDLQRFNQLNNDMQVLFREWDTIENREWENYFVSLLEIKFLRQLHIRLNVPLSMEELKIQVRNNIALLECIAKEFAAQVKHQLTVYGEDYSKDEYPKVYTIFADLAQIEVPPDIKGELNKIWLDENLAVPV